MKHWAKRGVLSGWEELKNPKATVKGQFGESHEVEVFQMFGFSYCPPADGSEGLLLPNRGNNDHLISLGFTGGKYRPKAEQGGSLLYSTKSGHTVELKPDGSTTITTGAGKFFKLDGDTVTTDMDIRTTGDVIADGVSLHNHTHPNTGPPVS